MTTYMFTNYIECLEHYLLVPDKATVLAKLVEKYTRFKLLTASIVFFVLLIVLLTSAAKIITIQKLFENCKN